MSLVIIEYGEPDTLVTERDVEFAAKVGVAAFSWCVVGIAAHRAASRRLHGESEPEPAIKGDTVEVEP